MYNSTSRRFALLVVTLTLSVPTFGQTPNVAPQTREPLSINPPSTVAAPPSPIPPGEKEKDAAVLQAVSDVAKAAIEANKVTMDMTATFYRERTEQDSRFFTNTTTLIGAFAIFVAGILSFFGVKGYQSLASKFSKGVEDEVRKFTTNLEQTQLKMHQTLQAKEKNGHASILITQVLSHPNISTSQKESLYSEALRSLDESLKIKGAVDPKTRAHTYAMRGYIRRQQSDIPGALNDITAALDLVQDNASYYYNGACYNNLSGNKEKARSLLEKACALDPIYRPPYRVPDPDLEGL